MIHQLAFSESKIIKSRMLNILKLKGNLKWISLDFEIALLIIGMVTSLGNQLHDNTFLHPGEEAHQNSSRQFSDRKYIL